MHIQLPNPSISMDSHQSSKLHPSDHPTFLGHLKLDPRTNDPYLRLPPPHSNIIITPPRSRPPDGADTDDCDEADMIEVLNDFSVTKNLTLPPYPFQREDADKWVGFARKECS